MNELLQNEEQLLRVQNFLQRNASRFNLQPQEMGRMKINPSELYVHSKIVAGGNVPLLTGNTTQEVGVTNFDGNRLESGRFFVIEAISILYGEAAAGTKVWDVKYEEGNLPPQLRASHAVVRQNGDVILRLPVESIFRAQKSATEKYRKLGALAVLEPNQTIEITVETPQGSTITPATSGHESFISFMLKGYETYLKR